ncbi:acyl-CoA thioesterase [Deinococcus sp. KNUC1210]|uniref:acyl-CoA thioesterase n=1 Tax=Deinococcus sp. KNUC1210 TaxID=2917691 RepID=UPI001EF09008|nr:thioesterase family protein [Deinococcus sp. KNUC1210]ULH16288.1 acyl-CoA thioesterase [Deinococcus sp. KNUC1210]
MTAPRLPLSAYPSTHLLPTRWADNDMYGHINNVAYYSYFDTAVNALLIAQGVLDPQQSSVIGLVVETGCQYFAPLSFPDTLTIGVGVERLGNSSVRYRLGVFRMQEEQPAAQGFFVHVYVDSRTRRPVTLPPELRTVLAQLVLKAPEEG